MSKLIEEVVLDLLKSNNTVTTLEVKNELRKRHPYQPWYQADVSLFMSDMYEEGTLDYIDNGFHRIYSLPKTLPSPQPTSITSNYDDIFLKLKNNGGRFVSVTTQNGDTITGIIDTSFYTPGSNVLKFKSIVKQSNPNTKFTTVIHPKQIKIQGIYYSF